MAAKKVAGVARVATPLTVQQVRQRLNITVDLIPRTNSNRPGSPLTARFVTIHNTDNDGAGADARAHAQYMKGQDAQRRQVSWHFTVDDGSVYQSLPINEVGWHAGSHAGNHSSVGIEICEHQGIDQAAANTRAALLTALMLHDLNIPLAGGVKQHHDWSGKDCPHLLRHPATRWADFLAQVAEFHSALTAGTNLPASGDSDHRASFAPTHLLNFAVEEAGERSAFDGGHCSSGWLVTGYFTAAEDQYSGPGKHINVDGHGPEVFPADFLKHVSIEGWGRTRFGWYLGWDHGWRKGNAAANAIDGPLVRGKSLAVDRNLIPLGTKVTIPSLPPPWNTVVFTADDVGGGINGKHVDVYCGDGAPAEQETFRITSDGNRLCQQ